MAKRNAGLAAVPAGGTRPRGWRSDLDPRALPPTDRLTLGQLRVLEACLVLFAEQGFAASSIRDIAGEAGMQSASLYNHFPSKDAMLTELVMLGFETHLERLIAAIVNAPAEPREQLRAAIQCHVTVHCEFPNLGLVVNHEARHLPPDARVHVESNRRRSAGLVEEVLARGVEQGVFVIRSGPATLFAMASMGVDAARWYPYQSDISAEQLSDEYAELALRMVGA
ncbi:MAG TPA: TetR/AcrR family transcriptional regulator [Mycobacteriales bacterium]|nr:TetR/AcrR family transcriptional regulator [Mycobacteriales bacterium]